MRKHLSLITAFLLLCLHGYAQEKATSKAADKSLLWRISNKEMKEPSYLFGTIHLICEQDYVWTDAMAKCLQAAKELCLELDMDDPNITMQIAMGMMNSNGKTLKSYFDDTTYTKLEKYMKDSVGMGIEMFQTMKPVMLLTMFSAKSPICSSAVSYETNLVQLAQVQQKEVTGLESVEEQLDLFDNLPTDSVIKEITDILNGKNSDKTAYYKKLINAYKNQDLPALGDLIKESGATDKDLGGFLDVRNEKWVPRMIEKMDKNSTFFAVGAGHLYGDNGVINLLRKAGYTVVPVK
ncbi:hypothetical protein CAP35_08715 [Chitinophagaceae bacterium IBVUCB1]|nr:hypothetical protein CAP35_08715 [Chitinophagaceae bacterium IBVUCB1]